MDSLIDLGVRSREIANKAKAAGLAVMAAGMLGACAQPDGARPTITPTTPLAGPVDSSPREMGPHISQPEQPQQLSFDHKLQQFFQDLDTGKITPQEIPTDIMTHVTKEWSAFEINGTLLAVLNLSGLQIDVGLDTLRDFLIKNGPTEHDAAFNPGGRLLVLYFGNEPAVGPEDLAYLAQLAQQTKKPIKLPVCSTQIRINSDGSRGIAISTIDMSSITDSVAKGDTDIQVAPGVRVPFGNDPLSSYTGLCVAGEARLGMQFLYSANPSAWAAERSNHDLQNWKDVGTIQPHGADFVHVAGN